jgi:hypothetical protein
MFVGVVRIFIGLVVVLLGLRGAPHHFVPAWVSARLWRVAGILGGLGYVYYGAFLALGHATVIALGYGAISTNMDVPAADAPLLSWTLWVLSEIGLLGGLVTGIMMWSIGYSRKRQLAQREPSHNA